MEFFSNQSANQIIFLVLHFIIIIIAVEFVIVFIWE